MLRDMGVNTVRVWQTSADDKTCEDICVPLDGLEESEWGDYADGPPAHVNCVLPGQEVAVPGLSAGAKSLYQGRVIEIATRNGSKFTVTENHPVLTPQGWIAAKFVREGDNVFAHSATERVASSVYPDYNHRPAMIEQVFGSLGMAQGMSTRSVPVSAVDLHGDGRGVQGEIEVVGSNRELMLDINTSLTQPVPQRAFGVADAGLVGVSGQSSGAFFGQAARSTTDGFMGFASEREPFGGTKIGHARKHGFASVTALDTGLVKYTVDSPAGDTELARQFLGRHAGYIRSDEVVSVLSREYSGHVYDLQSDLYGLYTVNGIIVKNCRCWTTSKVVRK
jgi:hypothetical protein